MTNQRLAVNRPGREDPDWLEVTAWGPTAEAACQHLRKGSKATVAGRVEADTIELDGKKYSAVKIHASQLDFELAARTDAGAAASREHEAAAAR